MARLIDDLLDVSRIVSGKIRLEVEAVDLATLGRGRGRVREARRPRRRA